MNVHYRQKIDVFQDTFSRPESSNLCLTIAQKGVWSGRRALSKSSSAVPREQEMVPEALGVVRWSFEQILFEAPHFEGWKATARSLGDLFFFLSTNRPVFQGMTLRFVCSYSHFSIAMFFWHSALVRFGAGWIRPAEKRFPPPAGWSVFWILQHTTWTVAIPF